MPKTITFTHLWGQLNFYTFQQDSAPAHFAYEMDEFWIARHLILCLHVAKCWHDEHFHQ